MEENKYKKEYALDDNGFLILENNELLIKDINAMSNELINNITNQDNLLNVKLKILSKLKEYCKIDKKEGVFPEPYGTFIFTSKKAFINRKILLQNISLYLGNIYGIFHTFLFQFNIIPVIEIPILTIDYNELYLRAIDEYFNILIKGKYEKHIFKNYNYNKENIKDYINIVTGEVEKVKRSKKEEKIKLKKDDYVYGTPYMLCTLIEKALIINLKCKLIYESIDKLTTLINEGKVVLDNNELITYNIYKNRGDKTLSENNDHLLYDILVKYNVIEDNADNALIIKGSSVDVIKVVNDEGNIVYNKSKKKITLASVMFSKYAKESIREEYMLLLNYLFGADNINYRNEIMHGNDNGTNYFNLIFSSILLQLFWDICYFDVFKNN